MRLPLQYKILSGFMAIVLIVLIGTGVGISMLIRSYLVSSKERELTDKGYEMVRIVNDYYDGKITHAQLFNFVNSVDSFLDARVWVVDENLNLLAVSEERREPAHPSAVHRSVPVKPSPMQMRDCDWSPNVVQRQPIQTNPVRPEAKPGTGSPEPSPGQTNIGDCDYPPNGNASAQRGGMHGMMGMWNNRQGFKTNQIEPIVKEAIPNTQVTTPGQTKLEKQENKVLLELGNPVSNNGVNSEAPKISLAEIKGMNEVIKHIEASNGKTWVVKYFHPYYEENMLVVAVPLKRADGTISGTVLLNAPIENVDWYMRKIYLYMGGAGFLAVLLSVWIANRLAVGIVRPLRAMQQTAAAMASGDYETRVRVHSQDEVQELGDTINSLAQDLSEFVSKTERMDKMRKDFVANVSHELKTPLTVMGGYAGALIDGTVSEPETVNKYHRIIRDEAFRLEKLITELLDLSALQSLNTPPDMEEISLAEITENVVTMLQDRATQKGVQILLQNEPNTPVVMGDGDRLTQLVIILLDNALKFTPTGGKITAGVSFDGNEEILKIEDTGEGIAAEDLPNIWERFYKADKSRSRRTGGTGLGLSIAKEIINIHGATVQVSSIPNEGTTFTLSFKINKVN